MPGNELASNSKPSTSTFWPNGRCDTGAERTDPLAATPFVPIAVRAALDFVVQVGRVDDGQFRGRAIGRDHLVSEFERYAGIAADNDCLVALDADQASLANALANDKPARVLTLSAGSSGRIPPALKPAPLAHSIDLPPGTWHALRYERVESVGFQGIGSLAWAVGERFFRRVGRPDLADRCRIGMLRTLVAFRPTSRLATTVVHAYRRCER